MDNNFGLYALKVLLDIFSKEISLDESNKLYENYKKRENILSHFMNDFLLDKRNILWNENGQLKIPASIFVQKFIDIMKEYLNYTQLDYFSIPIIGKISSGKSTFLNSLLGLDCLESNTIITTKFICIIRHNKELSTPKLYPVILQKRKSEINQKTYNFIKDEKNELKGDLNENIKKINKKISDCKDLNKLNNEEFFYILEANLDIFRGQNYIYSKIFEFMDLPGLNEITDFYLNNIIPLITPNTHFSIFLFDAGASEDKGTFKLFNKFLHLMNSKAKKNSFFIYNKLDIYEKDKNKQITHFKNDILFKTYKLKLKNNHLVGLDSIQLKYDKNKDNNFSDYIKSFIQSIPDKTKKKFDILFKKKLKEDFQIKGFPGNDSNADEKIKENKTEEDGKLLDEINKSLKAKNYEEIDIAFLIQMKIIFNEKKINRNSQIKENNKNGSEKFDELYTKFNKSFKDTVDDFVGENNLKLLLKTYNTLLIRYYELCQIQTEKEHIRIVIYHFFRHYGEILYPKMKTNKEDLINSDFNLYRFMNFEFEVKNIFDWNIESIDSLSPYLNSLKQFNCNFINKIIKNVENVLNYLRNRKLRLAFIGKEFSGKTSILNQIINNELLPIHEEGKDSEINIIFQYNNNNEVKLFKAEIQMIDNYFYFEKNDKPIATGIIDVKNKLIQLKNSKTNFENSFYILNGPTSPLINFKLIEDISDKIEIIYLSGKYLKDFEFGKNKKLEALIKNTDNFIYIEKQDDFSKSNFQYLKNIIFFISTINNSFNLNKFLYIVNKSSKNDENFGKKLDLIKTTGLTKISWLSIEEYQKFLKVYDLIHDDKIFITKTIEKIKKKKSNNTENNFDLINEIDIEVKSLIKLDDSSPNKLIKIFFNFMKDYFLAKDLKIKDNLRQILLDEGISEEEFNKNNNKINFIVDCLCHLQNEMNSHITFYNSNIQNFLLEFFNLIFDIKFYLDYDLKITTENTKDYLKSIFKLINKKLEEIDNTNKKYFFTANNENNEKNEIYNNFEIYFNEYKNQFLDKLEQYENKYILNFENIYNNSNKSKNIDKMMENEEKLFFKSIMDDLSNYCIIYDKFKINNYLNDLLLYSQIYLNDYNRSNIDNDSVKTEFNFGWFFLYNIKNKIKKYIIPKSINYMYKNQNLNKQECLNYYKFKFSGFKYFINSALKDIYLDMKNNLTHIIDFKLENFSNIKENSDEYTEICINLYDCFDDNDDEDSKNEKNI